MSKSLLAWKGEVSEDQKKKKKVVQMLSDIQTLNAWPFQVFPTENLPDRPPPDVGTQTAGCPAILLLGYHCVWLLKLK